VHKAEVKAWRYAPFFKNVDDSSSREARCLTGFGKNPAACGQHCERVAQKIEEE
jgi:hypothetical protein